MKVSTRNHLFDPDHYLDRDVHAAREFVRELSGNPEADLIAGASGAEFCAIAVSLAVLTSPSFDYDDLVRDPQHYRDTCDPSALWRVENDVTYYPWVLDSVDTLGLDDETICRLIATDYVRDPSGGELLLKVKPTPNAPSGPGGGTVTSFIDRGDSGEFPSLHLTA